MLPIATFIALNKIEKADSIVEQLQQPNFKKPVLI